MTDPMMISALENPEAANDAVKSVLAPAPPAELPRPQRPPSVVVTLPGGYRDPQGVLHREAVVRELTGDDEEALARIDAAKNMARFIGTLLQRGTVAIGDIDKPPPRVFQALLIGDRESLLLAIRRATYGDELKATVTCPYCQESTDMAFDLTQDVPVKELEDPEKRSFEVELRGGRMAHVCLPTGGDQDAMLAPNLKTGAEMNSLMLSRVIMDIDGEPLLGLDGVRAMGVQDRRTILEFIADTQPGPRYREVKLECPECGREFPLTIDLADLFR